MVLQKQLRDMNSKMVTNHCSDHRLALACRDSFQSVPAFKKLDETLNSLYKNTTGVPVRKQICRQSRWLLMQHPSQLSKQNTIIGSVMRKQSTQ